MMPSRKLLQAAVAAGAASSHQPPLPTQSHAGTVDGSISFSAFVFTVVTFFLLYAVYLNYCLRPRRRDEAAAVAGLAADAVGRERLEAMPAAEEKERCSICLGEYEDGEELRTLEQCKHKFHRRCVDTWLISPDVRCPLCRRVVVAPAEEENADDEE